MRVIYSTCILLCLSLSVSAQNISLHLSNASLKEAFVAIEKQADVFFTYRPNILPPEKNITINVNDIELPSALKAILKNTKLSFSIKGKYITIRPQESEALSREPDPFTTTGKVTDVTTGQGLPGVNVLIKGKSAGTATSPDGTFSVRTTEQDTLVFSFVGFKSKEVLVGRQTNLDIKLQEDLTKLDEVRISAGYYSTTDVERTGSIARVTAKDIERQPVTNPMMALQGRMPGVDISPNNGVAGSNVNIVIRGRNSISNYAAPPLYIVDGIPIDSRPVQSTGQNFLLVANGIGAYDPLSSINPANIESIEVLKDADATAIYGSRGANGVVLITTKHANGTEKTNIRMSFYAGLNKIPSSRFVKQLNTNQYVDMRKEALLNSGVSPSVTTDLGIWDTTRYTDWQKELLGGSAKIIDGQLSLDGGNSFTNFRIGVGYHHEGMMFPGDFGYQRVTGSLNLNHQTRDKKFRIAITANGGVENNKLFSGDIIGPALKLPPNAPALYDSEGNLNWENSTFDNPLVAFKKTDNNKSHTLNLSSNFSYELFSGVVAKLNVGFNTLSRNEVTIEPRSSSNPARLSSFVPTSYFSNTSRNSWIVEPQLNYAKQFGANKEHEIDGLIGMTMQESNSGYELIRATGYTSDSQMESLLAAIAITYTASEDIHYRYSAMFGRVGYSYKHKYLLNFTGRRDGSSRFGPRNRWGNFGAVGAGWIFSEEDWMKRIKFLSLGKVRTSFGVTGSDQIGDYKYLSTYSYMSNNYQSQKSLTPSGLANNDYAWEQTWKFEAALQLGFVQDRIQTEVSYYQNRCSNQLLNFQLPSITGFDGVTQNLNATVQNTGWEWTLNTSNINARNFQWSSALNLTLPSNKLLSYPGLKQSPDQYKYDVGQPLTIQKVSRYLGINPSTGLYQVEDFNGDGVIDYQDNNLSVNVSRRIYGGLSNSFRFKGIELSFLIQFTQFTGKNYKYDYFPGAKSNVPVEIYNGLWRGDGTGAVFQKPFSGASEGDVARANVLFSNVIYSDISFIRFKTVALSYDFPVHTLDRLHINGLKAYVQGQNLFVVSNAYGSFDPETGAGLPPLLMLTGGLDLKF
jgi:TonB-linked SusC/RagA family outer membrane protein